MFWCFSCGPPAAERQAAYEEEQTREEDRPGQASQTPVQPDPSLVGIQSVVDGSQSASFSRNSLPTQLSQMLAGVPAAGARSNDLWANLQKSADSLVGALAITASTFYIFTSSRRLCKVIPNSSSPHCVALRRCGWELCHAAECSSALQVVCNRVPTYFQVPRASPASPLRVVPADFQLLHHQAGCTAFLILPLYQGHTVVGALLLAHTEPIPTLAEHRWLAAYLPLLSLYLSETSALKLVNFTEKIQTAAGLNQLAWIISSELDTWFDWCHPDDTEARLVLLAPDQSAAMVLSRSVGALRAFDPVNSIDVLVSGGVRSGSNVNVMRRCSTNIDGDAPPLGLRRDPSFASRGPMATSTTPGGLITGGGKAAPEEGLLGTHMSLSNTLTRRCLAEGSKLLFVADVMAALKKYGEPWKDVFMEQARVTNPTWVVAAPIAQGGRHLGAILWLSSSRLNPNMLAQAAKASVPLLLHTVARQMIHLIQQASSTAGAADDLTVFWSQLLAMPHLNMLSGATATGFANGATGGGTGRGFTAAGLDTADMASSLGVSVFGAAAAGAVTPGGGVGGGGLSSPNDGPAAGGILTGGGTDGSGVRQLRYTVMVRSDSVSTSALVKAYQTAIQRAAATTGGAESGPGYDEIQVIAKAGQGAFGSVYVALWKSMVVAVKVMRQQEEGRRAMRTAWELAVTRSVSHPNIVMVYATFTDVVVVKLSRRLIRFVPAATTLADPGAGAGGTGGAGSQDGAAPADSGARCQVIIMEYCNMGPLHHYVAERRYAQQLATQQAERERQASGGAATAPPTGTLPTAGANATPSAPVANTTTTTAPPPSPLPPLLTTTSPPAAAASTEGPAAVVAEGGSVAAAPDGWSGPSSQAVSGATPQPQVNSSGSSSSGMPVGAVTGPVEFSTTLATLLEVASALQYLHSLGFIHCDLKPENVLLKAAPGDPRGFTIKVSDFGLSELLTSDGPLMGELGGTVTHIAPEIVTHKRVTKAADSYAFGVVMWELITGNRLYSDLFNSGREKRVRDKLILAKVAHEGLRPVFPEGTPYEYASLARRCWTADPALRPTFTEIFTELEGIQRRYCKNAQPTVTGLEGLLGTGSAAGGPAQQAPAAGAGAGANGGGGVEVGGAVGGGAEGGGTSPGGGNVPGGNTAPLPKANRATATHQMVRAATDVGMVSSTPRVLGSGASSPTPLAAPVAVAAVQNSLQMLQQQPQHAGAAPSVLPSRSGGGAVGPQVCSGNGAAGGGGSASSPPYGGGGGSAGGPLRAAGSMCSPSPLRQMSSARETPSSPGGVAGAATGPCRGAGEGSGGGAGEEEVTRPDGGRGRGVAG